MHNGWLAFEVPRFESNVRIHQTYWQLVLPQDEALVGGAGDLNPEYDWGWGITASAWTGFPSRNKGSSNNGLA